jgi:enoyl-CoA hydratase/carnithine racemase
MSTSSTVILDRPSPKVVTITFHNPPANVVAAETAVRLHEIVTELENDSDVQVVLFKSDVPDFFLNHFDLAAVDALPAPQGDELPIWTDLVVRLSNAPYITVGSIRGRTRGGGNELALALDLRYASLENAIFGQPEVGAGLLPGAVAAPSVSRCSWGATGRSRSSSAAATTTPRRRSAGDG